MTEYNLDKIKLSSLRFSDFRDILKDKKALVFIVIFAILVNTILEIIFPILIGSILDNAIKNVAGSDLVNQSLYLILISIGIYVTRYLQILFVGRIGAKASYIIRENLFVKLQKLPLKFFDQNKTGDLITRINTDTSKIDQLFSESLIRFLANIFVLIGSIITVIVWQPTFGLLFLLAVIILLSVSYLLGFLIRNKTIISTADLSRLNNSVEQMVTASDGNFQLESKLFLIQKTIDNSNTAKKSFIQTGIASGILSPIYQITEILVTLLILVVGLQFVTSGNITLGIVLSLFGFTQNIFTPLRIVGSVWGQIQVSLTSWSRVITLLDLPEFQNNNIILTDLVIKENKIIVIEDVSFGYIPNKPFIKNLNLDILAGETVAIIGPTGGGKSTIANLIAGHYQVNSGKIKLFNQNINNLARSEITDKIGYIQQDPFVFTGTLLENIVYGNKKLHNLSQDNITKLLEKYKLSEVIKYFSEGLATKFENNKSISLGQKQLVSFVRVILRDPEIIILDELTANIDTITEQILSDIMSLLPNTTTKIIIAHRLKTIKAADKILFVANGKIQKTTDYKEAVNLLKK